MLVFKNNLRKFDFYSFESYYTRYLILKLHVFLSVGSLSYIYIPLDFSSRPLLDEFFLSVIKMGGRFTFYGGLKIIFGGTHWSDAHRILKE